MSHSGFNPENRKLRDIGAGHYVAHRLYSYIEPKIILKLVDYLLPKRWLTKTWWGLCVSECLGCSRRMMVRNDYAHDHQAPAEMLLGRLV